MINQEIQTRYAYETVKQSESSDNFGKTKSFRLYPPDYSFGPAPIINIQLPPIKKRETGSLCLLIMYLRKIDRTIDIERKICLLYRQIFKARTTKTTKKWIRRMNEMKELQSLVILQSLPFDIIKEIAYMIGKYY